MERCDVAIIGAGPYGLSAAAHLRHVKGLDIRLFGEPMSFWEQHMPAGMRLRSPWDASHIADPGTASHLTSTESSTAMIVWQTRWRSQTSSATAAGFTTRSPCRPNEREWYAIGLIGDGYRLDLDDQRAVRARRVIVAGGIQSFAYRPDAFRGLPSEFVTHTSEQRDFQQFRDKEVLVMGGGQSALEGAGCCPRLALTWKS